MWCPTTSLWHLPTSMERSDICTTPRRLCVSHSLGIQFLVFTLLYSHPTAPTCTYDPVDGLILAPETVDDPAERVRLLEQQIGMWNYIHTSHSISCFDAAQLQSKLTIAQTETYGRSETSPPGSVLSKSDSPPSQGQHPSIQPIFDHSFDYRNNYNQPGVSDPFAAKQRNRPHSMTEPYSDNSFSGQAPPLSANPYFSGSSFPSDTRNMSYPNVMDDPSDQHAYYRSDSHPYLREQPHPSTAYKSERMDSFSSPQYTGIRPSSPLIQDATIASVSRLSRQVCIWFLFKNKSHRSSRMNLVEEATLSLVHPDQNHFMTSCQVVGVVISQTVKP